MCGWISVKEKLPEDGQIVIIYKGDVNVARFECGISMEERKKMEVGEVDDPVESVWSSSTGNRYVKRSKLIERADEFGNNKVPYFWVAPKGPMQWNGQDVSHWMPLPDSPND